MILLREHYLPPAAHNYTIIGELLSFLWAAYHNSPGNLIFEERLQ